MKKSNTQQKTKAKAPKYTRQAMPDEFRLRTGSTSLPFKVAPLKKELGSSMLKTLIRHTGLGTVEFFYVKNTKKLDYNKDGICFFDNNNSSYVLISLKSLASGLDVSPEEYKSYLPKKVVGAKKLGKRAAKAQEKEDILQAKTKLLGRSLHKNLTAKTKAEILDYNYWINYAINNLGVVPPTEVEVDARLIKTYKIYAIAFQVQHKIPVKIVREMLHALSSSANSIVELSSYDEARNILKNTRKSTIMEDTGDVSNHEIYVDVKCQSSNIEKRYTPATLIAGYEAYEYDADKNDYIATIKNEPVLSEDLAFLAEVTETRYNSMTPKDTKLLSDTLYFYVPMMSEAASKRKKSDSSMTLSALIRVAYEIAISINYTISRVDFN